MLGPRSVRQSAATSSAIHAVCLMQVTRGSVAAGAKASPRTGKASAPKCSHVPSIVVKMLNAKREARTKMNEHRQIPSEQPLRSDAVC